MKTLTLLVVAVFVLFFVPGFAGVPLPAYATLIGVSFAVWGGYSLRDFMAMLRNE